MRQRPVLYREYHPVAVGDGSPAARVRAAVTRALNGPPRDRDYATAWAGAAVRSVRVDDGVATVDITRPAAVPDRARAAASLQQLIWTVTATAERVSTVRLLVDGVPATDLFGAVDATGDLHRAEAAATLAPVWLYDPQEGDTVGRTFVIRIAGTVFEATAQLRVLDAGGAVVRERFVQLDAGPPARGTATVTVTLPPGRYTLEGFYLSAEDGSVQGLDDHRVTVR